MYPQGVSSNRSIRYLGHFACSTRFLDTVWLRSISRGQLARRSSRPVGSGRPAVIRWPSRLRRRGRLRRSCSWRDHRPRRRPLRRPRSVGRAGHRHRVTQGEDGVRAHHSDHLRGAHRAGLNGVDAYLHGSEFRSPGASQGFQRRLGRAVEGHAGHTDPSGCRREGVTPWSGSIQRSCCQHGPRPDASGSDRGWAGPKMPGWRQCG